MLFLHGLTNSADAWVPVMRALHRRLPAWRLIAVDLRGHGASFRPGGARCTTTPVRCFGIDDMAGDVTSFLDAMGIADAALAGHSMGSLVAQQVALDHPERVDDLVLVGTTSDARATPILGTWLINDVVEGRWRPSLEAQGIPWPSPAVTRTPLDADPEAVSWMQQYWNVYPVSPQRDTTRIAEQTARVPIATWLGATQGILEFHDTDRLRRLRAPTLVLWGTQDVFFSRADQRRLIAALDTAADRGGRFCWKQYGERPLPANGLQADDLGHNLTWEAPRQVADDIAGFVRRGVPTPTGFEASTGGRVVTTGEASVKCGGA
jgi:pimeloyl-ACP methyl ester carboxylesterase